MYRTRILEFAQNFSEVQQWEDACRNYEKAWKEEHSTTHAKVTRMRPEYTAYKSQIRICWKKHGLNPKEFRMLTAFMRAGREIEKASSLVR